MFLAEPAIDEPLSPIGKEVFLSLPDEEKYHHFLHLFERVQDLDFEVVDSREGLHQLQIELSQLRGSAEENKRLLETIRELKEENERLDARLAAPIANEEAEGLKKDLADMGQALLQNQQEKEALIAEKELLEALLKEAETVSVQPASLQELERSKEENRLLRMELQKIKEIVLQGLKEAKELKLKATSALQERPELERQLNRFRAETETFKRERAHFEELLKRVKTDSQQLLLKMREELETSRKELEQAKTSLAKRVKEVTLLEESKDEERVLLIERVKKLEDLLQIERRQRDAEIARLAGGAELIDRLSPHIEALHRMVVEKGRDDRNESDANSPTLFDALSKASFTNERLF